MDRLQKPQLKLRSIFAMLLVVVFITAFAICATAQTSGTQKNDDLVSVNIFDTDLKSVIQILISETKKNIMIADQDKISAKITLSMDNMPFETVLEYVAKGAACDFTKDKNGVYVISAKKADEPIQSIVNKTPVSTISTQLSSVSDDIFVAKRSAKTEKIDLNNTSPSEMMWILGVYKTQDYKKIKESKFKPGVYSRNQSGGLDPIYVPGHATPTMSDNAEDTANRNVSPDDEAAQLGGFSGMSGGGNRTSGNTGGGNRGLTQGGGGIGGVGGGGIGGVGGGTGGNMGGNSLLPEGIEFIMPYEMDNSIIVRGDEEGIDELKSLISQLDIAPKQIMIKAEFVEIDTTSARSLGINWQLERLSGSLQTNFSVPGNITVGYANGNVMATLLTQLSDSKAKLINAPLISTLNNVPAEIEISTTIPYLTSETIFNSNGNPNTVTVAEFMDITSELLVLPRINNADNSITVYLEPTISDSPGTVDTPNGAIPIESEQSLQTTRRVQNGETIVIGGIIRKNDTVNTAGIPLLKDLPFIGSLFKSTSRSVNDKELLIFLTPSIIPEKPVAGGGIGVTP